MAQQQSPYVIKEAALLIESGSYKTLDHLVLVSSEQEARIERVMKRDKISLEEVLIRMARQLPEEQKRRYCDVEITNDNKTLLIPQVLKLHKAWMDESKQR